MNRQLTLLLSAAVAVGCLTLMGCKDGQTEVWLTASGATTLQPLLAEAAEAYREVQPNIYIESHGGGSSRGVLDVSKGRSEIGGVAREVTEDELAVVRAIPLALDGLAIVVSSELAIKGVTREQLRQLYSSEAVPEGLPDELIRVTKADGHGTLQAFLAGLGLARGEMRADVTAGSNSEVLQVVAASANVIGYVSNVDAQAAIAAGLDVRVVALGGVHPSGETVGSGAYKLSRRLFIVTAFQPPEEVRAFLDFLCSPEGRRIIERAGFVPL